VNNQSGVQNGQAGAPANAQNQFQGQGEVNTPGAAANGAAGARRMSGAIPRNSIPGQNQAAARQQQLAQRRGVAGTISGLQSNSLTFNNGTSTSQYSLTPDTRVELNGQNVALDELPANANVRIFTNPRNPNEIQRIVAGSGTAAATQGQDSTQTDNAQSPPSASVPNGGGERGFDGYGNDIAGKVNPDGSITRPDGTILPPSSTNASTDQRTSENQVPSQGASAGFTGTPDDVTSAGRNAPPRRELPPLDYLSGDGKGTNARQPQPGGERQLPSRPTETNAGSNDSLRPGAAPVTNGQGQQNSRASSDNTRSGASRSQTNARAQMATRETWKGPSVDLGWKLQQSSQGVTLSNLSSEGVAMQSKLQEGDVITAINGQKISSPRDLSFELHRLSPNSKAEFQVLRNGEQVTQTLTLPSTHKPLFPRSAAETADEIRALEAQVEAARKQD
jgi:hypothetical protein